MEAATLSKKKPTISKGKVKKNLRNVLCRPDPVFWPEVSDKHGIILKSVLEKHKVDIPEFKKPHWKEIKSIPKDQRPKPPKTPRVEGLLFGITDVTTAVQNKQCSAVVIESSVNPRTIVLPLIELCISDRVPTLCLNGLKKITAANFGIPTSCLGIKCDYLKDLSTQVCDLIKHYKPPQSSPKECSLQMEVNDQDKNTAKIPMTCPYLYRTSKRMRVFNPSLIESKSKKPFVEQDFIEESKSRKAFVGQDFIEFSDKPKQNIESKTYMSMILNKICKNQNRVKRK